MSNIYEKMKELMDKRETFAVATIISHRGSVPRHVAKMIVAKNGKTYGTLGGGCVEGQVAERSVQLLREGTRGVVVESYDLIEEEFGGIGMNCGGKIDVSIEIVTPQPRLIIAGSGHLSSAIAKLGDMLGFEIIIIDAMAGKESFPQARTVIPDFVETSLPGVQVLPDSFIVIVTRHKDDLPALRASLKTNAGYIGLIGSRRRVAQAFQLLMKEGFTEEQLRRVNAPIGLEIGAETPEEIAVSIIAEIIQRRHTGIDKAAEPKKIDPTTIRTTAREISISK